MKAISKVVLIAPLLLLSPGCAAVLKALPTIIQRVQDAQMILDMIDKQAQPLLEQFGNPDLRQEYSRAYQTAQQTLQVALRSAKGTEDLSQEQVDEAFTEFREAYKDLLGVLRRAGLLNADGAMKAAPGVEPIVVPEPLALKPL